MKNILALKVLKCWMIQNLAHLLKCGMPFTINLEIEVLVDTDYLDVGIAINRHDGIQMSLAISSWEGS